MTDDEETRLYQAIAALSLAVAAVIAGRINDLAKLDRSDAMNLYVAARQDDIAEMNTILDSADVSFVASAMTTAQEEQDAKAASYYEATGMTAAINDGLTEQIAAASTDDVQRVIRSSSFGGTSLEQDYDTAIMRAVSAITSGADYRSTTRSTINELASGLNTNRVTYASGATRSLTSAVMMNVSDGVAQVHQQVAEANGKAFGADGWEISTHALCAADHLPIQGRIFARDDPTLLGLERPIGTLNCKHIEYPVIMSLSKQSMTDGELQKIDDKSQEQVSWSGASGKSMTGTRYEASQYQRMIENRIRNLRSQRSTFEMAGDTQQVTVLETRVRDYLAYYRSMSDQMGIESQVWRTR